MWLYLILKLLDKIIKIYYTIFTMENNKLIYKNMNDILAGIDSIEKNKQATMGAGGSYKFRGIDDMYNILHPLFAKNKVFLIPKVLEVKTEIQTKANGGLQYNSVVKLSVTFFAEDGSNIEAIGIGHSLDNSDKGTNKAQSSALKYILMQTFLIPTEESKDVENDNIEVAYTKEQIVQLSESHMDELLKKPIETLKSYLGAREIGGKPFIMSEKQKKQIQEKIQEIQEKDKEHKDTKKLV
jgi:hypothetical protein